MTKATSANAIASPRVDDASNAASDSVTGLRMDPRRTHRFTDALGALHRTIHSLEAAVPHFRWLDILHGQMDPGQTIRAFASTMREDIDFVYLMLANEEAKESRDE